MPGELQTNALWFFLRWMAVHSNMLCRHSAKRQCRPLHILNSQTAPDECKLDGHNAKSR